jgi:hypothetical protein
MPRFSKAQFKKLIGEDGRAEYKLPRMPKAIWEKLLIDAKNEMATDDMVEDGWQLDDICYTVEVVGKLKLEVDVTVNVSTDNWNQNEE